MAMSIRGWIRGVCAVVLLATVSAPAYAELTLWLKYHYAAVDALNDGRVEDAKSLFEAAEGESSRTMPVNNFRLASTLDGLGQVYFAKGDFDTAEAYFQRALDMRREVLGPHTRDVPEAVLHLAEVKYAKSDSAMAERLFRQVLLILVADQTNVNVCKSLDGLARIQHDRGNIVEAESLLLRSRDLHLLAERRYDPAYAKTVAALGAFYASTGKLANAKLAYDDALVVARRALRRDHPDIKQYESGYNGVVQMMKTAALPTEVEARDAG